MDDLAGVTVALYAGTFLGIVLHWYADDLWRAAITLTATALVHATAYAVWRLSR